MQYIPCGRSRVYVVRPCRYIYHKLSFDGGVWWYSLQFRNCMQSLRVHVVTCIQLL